MHDGLEAARRNPALCLLNGKTAIRIANPIPGQQNRQKKFSSLRRWSCGSANQGELKPQQFLSTPGLIPGGEYAASHPPQAIVEPGMSDSHQRVALVRLHQVCAATKR